MEPILAAYIQLLTALLEPPASVEDGEILQVRLDVKLDNDRPVPRIRVLGQHGLMLEGEIRRTLRVVDALEQPELFDITIQNNGLEIRPF